MGIKKKVILLRQNGLGRGLLGLHTPKPTTYMALFGLERAREG